MAERSNQQNQSGQRQARENQPQQSQSGARQQQAGGQHSPSQQQQFDSGSRQPGGGGGEGRLADRITKHMEIVDQNGAHVGTVDHIDGDRIKLTRASSGTGEHQYIPLDLVAGIEDDRVRLRDRGDTTFGMEAES